MLLIEQPEVWRQLKSDPEAYLEPFVEEVLRLESPVQGLLRETRVDVELHGVTIPAGAVVQLRFGAANRDERQFECPRDVEARPQASTRASRVRRRHPPLPRRSARAPGALLRLQGAGRPGRRALVRRGRERVRVQAELLPPHHGEPPRSASDRPPPRPARRPHARPTRPTSDDRWLPAGALAADRLDGAVDVAVDVVGADPCRRPRRPGAPRAPVASARARRSSTPSASRNS